MGSIIYSMVPVYSVQGLHSDGWSFVLYIGVNPKGLAGPLRFWAGSRGGRRRVAWGYEGVSEYYYIAQKVCRKVVYFQRKEMNLPTK